MDAQSHIDLLEQKWRGERLKLRTSGIDPLYLRDLVQTWMTMLIESRSAPDSAMCGTPPNVADAGHSALLYRLFSGDLPEPHPPPLSYSYPWYGIADREIAYVDVFFPSTMPGTVVINQSTQWEIKEQVGEDEWIVSYAPANVRKRLVRSRALINEYEWSLIRIDDPGSEDPQVMEETITVTCPGCGQSFRTTPLVARRTTMCLLCAMKAKYAQQGRTVIDIKREGLYARPIFDDDERKEQTDGDGEKSE